MLDYCATTITFMTLVSNSGRPWHRVTFLQSTLGNVPAIYRHLMSRYRLTIYMSRYLYRWWLHIFSGLTPAYFIGPPSCTITADRRNKHYLKPWYSNLWRLHNALLLKQLSMFGPNVSPWKPLSITQGKVALYQPRHQHFTISRSNNMQGRLLNTF